MLRIALLIASILFPSLLWGQPQDYFLNTPNIRKHVIIIAGAAVSKEYAQRFQDWSFRLYDALIDSYGYSTETVTLLLGNGQAVPMDDQTDEEAIEKSPQRISGSSRREVIQQTLASIRQKVRAGDQIAFVLIGHGTSDDESAKFNIVGPDITGNEFAAMLQDFPQQDLIVVNTTSSSHAFCLPLVAPGRVLISATRSAVERYDTIFPEYFVEAIAQQAGDRDKNKRVSMWEAFHYTQAKVKQWYQDQDRLPSEHATLDDNADGLFSYEPNPLENDGRLAQIAFLNQPTRQVLGSKAKRELYTKLQNLERSIFLLKTRKHELALNNYLQQLEPLLIDLARTTRQWKKL